MSSDRKGSTTADLLAALDQPIRKLPGNPCRVSVILSELEPELSDKVASIIEELRAAREQGTDSKYTCAWLSRTLTEHGYQVSPLVIGIHVRRGCRCE